MASLSALRTRLQRRDDAGFTMVEAIVSAMVLLMFSAGIAGIISSTLVTTKQDRQRVAASNLAAREMEIVRDSFATSDASALSIVGAGSVTNANPLSGTTNVVDGVAYTVSRTAAWLPRGNSTSACDGGSEISYPSVRVSVSVTWPGMRNVKPVTSESLVTPSKQLLKDNDLTFVAVRVVDFAQAPSAGRTVLGAFPGGSRTQLTDATGCAVFSFLGAGAFTARLNEAGYVSNQGEPAPSQSRTLAASSFTQLSFTYDRSATLDLQLTAPAGHAFPTTLPAVTLANTQMLPSPKRTVTVATTASTLPNVAPYSESYTIYAGSCPDSDPRTYPSPPAGASIALTPGERRSFTVPLGGVEVAAASSLKALQVVQVRSSCNTAWVTVGFLNLAAELDVALPYGNWSIRAGTSGNGSSVSVTPSDSAEVTV